ncbi:MAG: hypothetical protein IPO38_10210 [Rhodocyclaceae bacterium]|nr:hypothetical protein [Rhodocyclaceae bacterium]
MVREVPHAMIRHDGGDERVVKGAPYCADANHETVQLLPDSSGGAPNKIVKNTATRLCRDGEGRTRQEVTSGGRKLVYLRDPVTKENWVLDPERKTARSMPGISEVMAFVDGNEPGRAGEWARELRDKIKEQVTTSMAAAGAPGGKVKRVEAVEVEPVVITRNESASEDGKEKRVEVKVIRTSGAGKSSPHSLAMLEGLHELPAEGLMPLGVRMQALSFAPRGTGVTTSLGNKEIEGVRVNGERTTWTIEAGKIGNERAIVSTREVWTSPDLLLTVHSKEADPRNGDVTYKLERNETRRARCQFVQGAGGLRKEAHREEN